MADPLASGAPAVAAPSRSAERGLALAGVALAALVVALGAYTRLVDAGLGCPDWPGCYGFITVPASAQELAAAEARFPDAPVEPDKAWPEMVHRYFASGLGLLAFAVLALAWRRTAAGAAPSGAQGPGRGLPFALVVLVIVQGAFGAWTVTLKLWPQVVTAHLLGGFATLGLLWVHALRLGAVKQPRPRPGLAVAVRWVIAVVVAQVALGGWTSSNYAALACPDFPLCHGHLAPPMDFAKGFDIFQDIGPNYLGGALSSEARIAIQVTHRIGAFITLFAVAWLAWRVGGALGGALAGIVAAQFGLGLANVWLQLPLAVATLHNAGAATLLLALLTVHFAATTAGAGQPSPPPASERPRVDRSASSSRPA